MGLRVDRPYDYRSYADDRRYDDRLRTGYIGSVRHPWLALIFLIPLLAFYEIGIARQQAGSSEPLRAGVELWLRHWLVQSGSWPAFIIPASLLTLVTLWAFIRWYDRPDRYMIPLIGTAVEGIIAGFGLWILCLKAPAILEANSITVASMGNVKPQVITFIGVGIYEEAIFRMLGFALLARVLRLGFFPGIAALPIALIVSSAAFAMVHHFVQTDPFVPVVFLTRMLIGAYLAVLFWLRGLGVAIGAHVVYDLLVGLPRD